MATLHGAGMGELPDKPVEMAADVSLRDEVRARMEQARKQAVEAERFARTQRNVEAACLAALEILDRGLKAQAEVEQMGAAEGVVAAGDGMGRY